MNHRLIPVLLLFILTSCDTQDVCDDDPQSILVARFRTIIEGEITDTIVPGMSVYGIREGMNNSLLVDSLDIGRMELPLDPSNEQSRFVISTAEKADTLILVHSSEAYLISYNCGFAARFALEEFSSRGGMIVDMELIKASIDAELETDEEHLWIYF